MADNNYSLINLDGLAEPVAKLATELLNKISSAIGWYTAPSQI